MVIESCHESRRDGDCRHRALPVCGLARLLCFNFSISSSSKGALRQETGMDVCCRADKRLCYRVVLEKETSQSRHIFKDALDVAAVKRLELGQSGARLMHEMQESQTLYSKNKPTGEEAYLMHHSFDACYLVLFAIQLSAKEEGREKSDDRVDELEASLHSLGKQVQLPLQKGPCFGWLHLKIYVSLAEVDDGARCRRASGTGFSTTVACSMRSGHRNSPLGWQCHIAWKIHCICYCMNTSLMLIIKVS